MTKVSGWMKREFVSGFVKAMKDIQAGNKEETITDTDLSLLRHRNAERWTKQPSDFGYIAAINHFNGETTNDVDYARELGLVDLYDGFWGQQDWVHPEN